MRVKTELPHTPAGGGAAAVAISAAPIASAVPTTQQSCDQTVSG